MKAFSKHAGRPKAELFRALARAMGASKSLLSLKGCFEFLELFQVQQEPDASPTSLAPTTPQMPKMQICQGCEVHVDEFAQNAQGLLLCRACLRREDEDLLKPSEAEQDGLDQLAKVLDSVSWKYWKPGQQPAQILDWMFLGDLKEATDFELLKQRGITAVLNLINWWELSSRLPEVSDFSLLYSSHEVEFLEVDSEDRLFFDIVDKCWPMCESFLRRCRAQGKRVLVNCKAGHNRSACICICWLVACEKYGLLEAVDLVQTRRGTILSNHGFRLQLLRLAFELNRLGRLGNALQPAAVGTNGSQVKSIINEKRMTVQYDAPKDNSFRRQTSPFQQMRPRKLSLISEEVHHNVNQRSLKVELLACLYHRNKKFLDDYEYTSTPATIIGSGFSGDVVLCKRREKTAVVQNQETSVRCVKNFDLQRMGPDKLEKLKNEAVIYLSLEHPHIARLFDVYEDDEQVSLVMQYCAGGTLESARAMGPFSEKRFQDLAVPMLLAVNYIHACGIVHRDIKPRNWVYEADQKTIKLIDFGFSVKGYLSSEGLRGCMGTLGYLAPEVVTAGLSNENAYTDKCDIWSLGVVFVELLTGEPAFHRDAGQCDGYTEEVVLREIKEVTEDSIQRILGQVPFALSKPFLEQMLTKEPLERPSAKQVLDHSYLANTRASLAQPASALPVCVILDRFRAHARASTPTRAWLLAVARSPTYLPWEEFCALRDTFKMFDARGLNGTVNLETFQSVIQETFKDSRGIWMEHEDDSPRQTIAKIWRNVCGEQESLSYCEFLAVLLPPMEDVFEDAAEVEEVASPLQPREHWHLSKPVSKYFSLMKRSFSSFSPEALIFDEEKEVKHVVSEMARFHRRWALVRFKDGRHEFFDYMDMNHRLLEDGPGDAAESLKRLCSTPVGHLANCSHFCACVPLDVEAPLRDVLQLIASRKRRRQVRRVPLMDGKKVVGVFSCLDFLNLALRSTTPTAVLKATSAKVFDRRSTMLQVSVTQDEPLLHALSIMKSEGLTICPVTSRELSGSLGGVVASNVVSAADLKWVIRSGQFEALNGSVQDFVAFRRQAENSDLDHILRQQRLKRFNVVSASEDASLHKLARRLVDSKLQRIFLSSDDIARIVGIVSSRDIMLQVLDQLT